MELNMQPRERLDEICCIVFCATILKFQENVANYLVCAHNDASSARTAYMDSLRKVFVTAERRRGASDIQAAYIQNTNAPLPLRQTALPAER